MQVTRPLYAAEDREREERTRDALAAAALRTVAYGDVFDYALSIDEIHRYFDGVAADAREVQRAVKDQLQRGHLARVGDLITLSQRTHLAELRERRAKRARELWVRARHYGRRIARLPFVRMVAVTGALAVDNPRENDDIDLMIVTEPGRLWSCRAFVILLIRWAGLRGTRICPNYLLSTNALLLQQRSHYAARELAQMVPLSGIDLYLSMMRLNSWAESYLPNAFGSSLNRRTAEKAPSDDAPLASSYLQGWLGSLLERVLRSPRADPVERWERKRKISELERRSPDNPELVLGEEHCKGHVHRHGERVRLAYQRRLSALGLEPLEPFER